MKDSAKPECLRPALKASVRRPSSLEERVWVGGRGGGEKCKKHLIFVDFLRFFEILLDFIGFFGFLGRLGRGRVAKSVKNIGFF